MQENLLSAEQCFDLTENSNLFFMGHYPIMQQNGRGEQTVKDLLALSEYAAIPYSPRLIKF